VLSQNLAHDLAMLAQPNGENRSVGLAAPRAHAHAMVTAHRVVGVARRLAVLWRAARVVDTKNRGRREAYRWGPGNSSGWRFDLLQSSKFQTI
jgi:hypothetical protein